MHLLPHFALSNFMPHITEAVQELVSLAYYTFNVVASINEADFIQYDITKTCCDEINTRSLRKKSSHSRWV